MSVIRMRADKVILQGSFDGVFSTPVGSTKNTGSPDTPVRRRVLLLHQSTGRPVREVWSNKVTGSWQVLGLAAGVYSVIAFDHTGLYGAEAESDIVVPEPAP